MERKFDRLLPFRRHLGVPEEGRVDRLRAGDRVDRRRAGVAAAALNAARQSGSALGVAIFGACIATLQPFPVAMRAALVMAIALSAFAAATWWITTRHAPANGESAAHLQAATRR